MGGCARPVLSKPHIDCVDPLGLSVLCYQQPQQLDAQFVQHGLPPWAAAIITRGVHDERRSSCCPAGVRVLY